MKLSSRPPAGSVKIIGGQLYRGATVTSAGALEVNPGLLIKNGRVAALGPDALAQTADETLMAENCIVSPGFLDLCCNLREPGNGQKGNMASETRAAAHGGFTSVCAAPDTSPVNDSGAVTNLIRDMAASRALVRVLLPVAWKANCSAIWRVCRRQVVSHWVMPHGACVTHGFCGVAWLTLRPSD